MRKYLLLFLSTFMALFAISVFAENSTSSFKPFTGKVIGNKIRLRAGPSLDGAILKELNKNTLLLIVGEKNDYYAVKPFDNTKVYVYRNYIIDNIVENDRVNVRLKPNLESYILGQLSKKQRIEGKVYSKNNKWYELTPPSTINFYVAKDYIKRAGDSTYYTLMMERKEEVSKLLNSAYFITQKEIKKPFSEMDPQKAISQFEAIIKGYTDFPESVQQAKEGLALLQDNYLQKKIVYLETKANMAPEEKEEIFKEVSNLKQEVNTKKIQRKVHSNNLTQKMNTWVCVEEELYNTWTTFHPEKSIDDFYKEQKANALTLRGRIEPYDQNIQNKPGDYILKGNDIPLAYLYSIHVDLEKYIGKEITITVSPRPNNNFAFPAYFVNSIK